VAGGEGFLPDIDSAHPAEREAHAETMLSPKPASLVDFAPAMAVDSSRF
jgi:hypothetical protein